MLFGGPYTITQILWAKFLLIPNDQHNTKRQKSLRVLPHLLSDDSLQTRWMYPIHSPAMQFPCMSSILRCFWSISFSKECIVHLILRSNRENEQKWRRRFVFEFHIQMEWIWKDDCSHIPPRNSYRVFITHTLKWYMSLICWFLYRLFSNHVQIGKVMGMSNIDLPSTTS